MRVAVLFFGQPRFLSNKESYNSHYNHIFSKYHQVDTFVHSWWSNKEEDIIPSSWSQLSTVPYERHAIRDIRSMYNPAHAVYEEPKQFDVDETLIGKIDFIRSKDDLNNIKSHLYSIKRVGQVFQDYTSPDDYDFIVLTRFDGIILEFPDLNSLGTGFFRMANHPGIADQMFVFSPKYMEFLNVYDHYDELNANGADYTLEKLKKDHFFNSFPGKDMLGTNINVILARS